MKKITLYCDICKSDVAVTDETIQVIFTTEQTEGRMVHPYLHNSKMDICELCVKCVLQGNYIFANGAMGFNNYYFQGSKNEK